MSKKEKQEEVEGYLPLVEAIKAIRERHPWWPENSIRDAVRKGLIPSRKASLRPRAKYYVRISDIEAFVEKLKVLQVEPEMGT
jgi:hypothetical protein